MANSVDLDEPAHYKLSHLDLHCLQKYLSWFTGLKGLNHVDGAIWQRGILSVHFTMMHYGKCPKILNTLFHTILA